MAQPTHFFDKLRALLDQQNAITLAPPQAGLVFPDAQPAPVEPAPPPSALMPQPQPVQPPPPSLFTPPEQAAPAPIIPEPEPLPPPPAPPMPGLLQQLAPAPDAPHFAPPPSSTFLRDAMVNIGAPPAPPVPIVERPSAGLIETQGYSPAPAMSGYAMARTGSPFRAPQQAPTPSLWDVLGQPPQQPYSLWKGY